MRRLFPLTAESASPDQLVDHEWGLDELAEAYAYPDPDPEAAGPVGRPGGANAVRAAAPAGADGAERDAEGPGPGVWLRANMVSSVDGASWHDGRSHPLSSNADMRIFGVLRGLADVVVAGAETVRKEGYRPAKARNAFAERRAELGQTPAPAIAVVSASLDLDYDLPLFTRPVTPTLVLTGAAAVAERPERVERARAAGAEVLIAGNAEGVEPELVVGVLADRGLRRVLTEGGPRLLGQFAAAGVLDELCCTLAPVVAVGEAPRIADGPRIAVPKRFSLVSVLEEEGFLFTRYCREPAVVGQAADPERDAAAPDI